MPVDLRPLIQLHLLDQQISALESQISSMPAQIQELDKKLERYHKSVGEKERLIAENQKKRKELEGELALIETRRNRYKEQLDSVKTNKEYTALKNEIDGVTAGIRQIEDQILTYMEEAEALKAQVDEAIRAREKEEKVILGEKKQLQSRVDALTTEMQGLQSKREKFSANIPSPIMDTYENTRSHRRGIAMAEAKDAICQVCQMRIRPQLFQEIKRNDTIITCESCSRILFYIPPGGLEKQEVEASIPKEHQ